MLVNINPLSNTERKIMVYFGYGRVSTQTQSPENQRLEISKAGYPLHNDFWFEDIGISGKVCAKLRPEFSNLLLKIRTGETLVVSKLDRLGRDAVDVMQTIRLLGDRGVKVIVLQLGCTDLTSSAGKLLLSMLAAVAEMERDLLVERTHAGLQRAKAKGKTLGRPRKTTTEQRNSILAELHAGKTVSELARTHYVSRATIIGIRNAGKQISQHQGIRCV